MCTRPEGGDADAFARIVGRVQERGRAWVSAVTLPDGDAAIRACITSYATTEDDLRILVDELESACRAELS